MQGALGRHVAGYLARHTPDPVQGVVLRRLLACRTAALGGHLHTCDDCGWQRPRYNSCRDRHCSQCQGAERAEWLEAQQRRMLPVPHFQVVFTLPAQLRAVALCNQALVYGAMFDAAAEVLRTLAEQRLDRVLGITMVLHTWASDLRHHPHVHALVTAGGQRGEDFVPTDDDYLLPHRLMAATFKAVLLATLRRAAAAGRLLAPLDDAAHLRKSLRDARRKRVRWVVHVEPPAGRDAGIAARYLARYARGVALSDHRVLSIDEHGVTLRARERTVTLDGPEFVRRLLLHVLPPSFRKVRHYGLYAPGAAAKRRQQLRTRLAGLPPPATEPAPDPDGEPVGPNVMVIAVAPACPRCRGALQCRGLPPSDATLPWLRLPRGPP